MATRTTAIAMALLFVLTISHLVNGGGRKWGESDDEFEIRQKLDKQFYRDLIDKTTRYCVDLEEALDKTVKLLEANHSDDKPLPEKYAKMLARFKIAKKSCSDEEQLDKLKRDKSNKDLQKYFSCCQNAIDRDYYERLVREKYQDDPFGRGDSSEILSEDDYY